MRAKFLYLFLAVAVTACASFNPQLNMSFYDFNKMTGLSFNGYPELVYAKGSTKVYRIPGNPRTNYVFENNILTRVEQAENTQIRYQLETITR
jgi:hypothetical protein